MGLALAFAAARAPQTLLFQMPPTDPTSYALAGLGLAGLAALAGYLPARSAMRADPASVLRSE